MRMSQRNGHEVLRCLANLIKLGAVDDRLIAYLEDAFPKGTIRRLCYIAKIHDPHGNAARLLVRRMRRLVEFPNNEVRLLQVTGATQHTINEAIRKGLQRKVRRG